jgi:hypothetical protein
MNRHNRPISAQSERVFVGANFWTRLPLSGTNPALAPMSRAELEHALARVLEGKEIRLKNNKLALQPRCIEQFETARVGGVRICE